MKKYIITSIAVIVLATNLFGQNQVSLSQYMIYQPMVNPSALSTYKDLSIGLIHRSQWSGFSGAPKTNIFSVNMPIGKTNFSAGIGFQQEEIGITRTAAVFGNAAYKVKFDEKTYLSLGLSLGLNNFSYDYAQLNNSQSASSGFDASSLRNLNGAMARFGLYFVKNKFYATVFTPNLLNQGYTVTNMNARGTTGFKVSDIHYYAQTGIGFPISKNIEGNASALLKLSSTVQADLNFQFVFSKIVGVGASYRTNNEFVALVNVKLFEKLKIGYAYDFGNSNLRTASSGTHEILLTYVFTKKREKAIIEVPRF